MSPRQKEIILQIQKLTAELLVEDTGSRPTELKAQGFPAGPAPFGYSAQPRTDEERRLKIRKPLVENAREQETLRLAESLRSAGDTFDLIAGTLNGAGYRTRSGGKWVFQSVARILKGQPKVKAA